MGTKNVNSIRGFSIGRVLILVAAFLVTLCLLLGTALYLMSDDDYRDVLIWSADFFFDSQLEIDGAFAVGFGRKTQLNAENIRLKANDGSYALTIADIYIEQNVDAYIKTGTLWINSLRLSDLNIEIFASESDEETGWQDFSIPSVVMEKVEFSNVFLTYTERDQQQHTFKLSYLILDEKDNQSPIKIRAAGMLDTQPLKFSGTFSSLAKLRAMRDDQSQTYPIDFSLSGGPADGKPARKEDNIVIVDGFIGSASSGDSLVELTLDVQLSELIEVFSEEDGSNKLGRLQSNISLTDEGGSWRIKKIELASTDTSLYQLHLVGVVDRLNKNAHIELKSELSVPSPQILGEYLGINLSGYAPYAAKGMLTGDKNQLNYKGNTTIGRIESQITLLASLKNNKPFIHGELNIPVLYLSDIGINEQEVEQTTSPIESQPDESKQGVGEQGENWRKKKPTSDHKATFFDRERLDFASLQEFDLDLSILIDQVEGAGYDVDQVRGELKLDNGVLRISPVELIFENGATNLELEMDLRKTPEFSLKIKSEDLVLGQLIAQLESEVPIKGKANLLVDLTSRGHSFHELASALSGTLRFSLDDASLPRKYIEFLSVDVFGWVVRKGTFGSKYTPVGCILIDFDIDQGVAKSNLLIADGPTLSVTGMTTVDLGEETLDMVLLPKQKKKIYSTMPPIKIYGPLSNPVVKALPKTAAATTIGGAVLLPAIFIPTYVVNKFWKRKDSSDSSCANFVKEHSSQ